MPADATSADAQAIHVAREKQIHGGYSAAYRCIGIPTVMCRSRQDGVAGPHIYTDHAASRALGHAAVGAMWLSALCARCARPRQCSHQM